MNSLVLAIRQNKLTVGMLLFSLIVYGTVFFMGDAIREKMTPEEIKSQSQIMGSEEIQKKEASFQKNITAHPIQVGFLFLVGSSVLVVGIGLNARWLVAAFKARSFLAPHRPTTEIVWGVRHLVMVLAFIFFLDALIWTVEAIFFYGIFKVDPPKELLLMVNSLLRNGLAAVMIVWLVTRKLGAKMASLGLAKNEFIKNIGRGVVAYLTILPVLLFSLILVAVVTQLFSHETQPQNVVQIYLKDSSDPYLLLFTLFVAGLGPIIEELFFRGFCYPAVKKRLGLGWGIFWTSVLFAGFHLNLAAFLPIFVFSAFLCYFYEKTGSLVPSMTAHVIHNLLMVLMIMGFKAVAGRP